MKGTTPSILVLGLALFALPATGYAAAEPAAPSPEKVDLKFSFGTETVPGFTNVIPSDVYTAERRYGFDLGSKVMYGDRQMAAPTYTTGLDGRPFFFSVKLAPGVYQVTVTLGKVVGNSTTTVKSETRRLMLEQVFTYGKQESRTFLVHLRVPQLPDGRTVALKDRERLPILYTHWDENPNDITNDVRFLELDWDEKLTLEFSGEDSALRTLQITNAEKPVTVYLIGDSTVTDQMMEPWGAWGQQLPRWFKPPVVIANYAESGETTQSFIGERRWAKVLSEIHPGDYVLMQFGINDRRLSLDQFKDYFRQFIKETRDHGATPVLVTSQNLRQLAPDGGGIQTLGDYPHAMWEVATEQRTHFIDLNSMSMKLYVALGPETLRLAFVDGTHQNMYGAYELAKCVVTGAQENKLPFTAYLVDDWKPFDPAQPDPLAEFNLPSDPQLDPARPGGPGLPSQGAMAGAPPAPQRGAPSPPATSTGSNN